MPQIHILDRSVAELIAAGEVVERPASVVKELLENSIDAVATKVTVEIRHGGISYLRVADDGCGIARKDVPKAFVRHATSKVLTAEDLSAIGTFGFRGEALASVAAMGKVELLTRTADSISGTRYVIHGSVEVENTEAGCPVGTSVVVRDLFYNTPARMKFLKKDSTEGTNVATVVDKLAMANPQVAIRFIRDGEVRLSSPGNGSLLDAIHSVYGKEFTSILIPVDGGLGSIRVEGFISSPKGGRSNRNMQNFYINSRYVRSKTCGAALEEAYKLSMMEGRFPSCVLNIVLPPEVVDVNVHPAKIEVRFSNEKLVFDSVFAACKEALARYERENFSLSRQPEQKRPPLTEFQIRERDHTDRQQRFSAQAYREMVEAGEAPKKTAPAWQGRAPSSAAPAASAKPTVSIPHPLAAEERPQWNGLRMRSDDLVPYQVSPEPPQSPPSAPKSGWQPTPAQTSVAVMEEPQTEQTAPEEAPLYEEGANEPLRLIGELFGTYILLEKGPEFILIDKHAAHERHLYNQLREGQGGQERQLLLTPVSVSLSRLEYDAVLENLAALEEVGFLVEDFGDGAVVVREAPTVVPVQAVAGIVEELAEKLLGSRRELLPELVDSLYHSIACRGAIKAHDKSSPLELEELARLIRERDDIRYCPHGRPVAASFTRGEIEKIFGRLG